MSRDHKPSSEIERRRIVDSGGAIAKSVKEFEASGVYVGGCKVRGELVAFGGCMENHPPNSKT